MVQNRNSGGRRGHGGRSGRGSSTGRENPFSRQRNFFYAMIKKEFAEFRGVDDAHRFIEAIETFKEKRELLDKLEDDRTFGAKRIQDVLSFIESNQTVEDLLIRLLRNILNDETSRPLTKRLRNRVLMNIYTVPGLFTALVELEVASLLPKTSADIFCHFLLELSAAFVEPRESESVMLLARSLRDRGDVLDVDRLCRILMVDEGSKSEDPQSAFDRRSRVVAWGKDLEPPGGRHDNDSLNYRNILLIPTLNEIICETPSYLPLASGDNAVIDDPCQKLLDANFRLLREDAVQAMKNNILDQHRVWKNARFIDIHCKGNAVNKNAISSLSFVIQCFSGKNKKQDWERTSALSYGSIVALCRDGIPVRIGKISIRNAKSKNEWLNAPGGPIIGITVESETEFGASLREMDVNATRNSNLCKLVASLGLISNNGAETSTIRQEIDGLLDSMISYDLVEISQSFSTYQPVLRTLQSMDLVPLATSLVHNLAETPAYAPNEFSLPDGKFLKGLACNLEAWNSEDVANSTSLDVSQAEALKHAFSSQVALIQGPPGTGKTFIGGIIARVIRENTDESIVCVCYTNHALDQFLEHMLDAGETRIVRIGGRSKSERVAPYQLRELSRRHQRTREMNQPLRQIDGKLYAHHERMETHIAVLKECVTWKSPQGGICDFLLLEHFELYACLSIPNVTDTDGFQIVGRGNRKLADDHLFKLWLKGETYPPWMLPFAPRENREALHKLWALTRVARLNLFEEWRQELLAPEVDALFSLIKDFNDMMEEKHAIRAALDKEILAQARIVGVTTTGAAQYRDILNEKGAGVLIVEEAGEVLEAHVLTSLSEGTKHLILIGDHKQLRPKVETFELTAVANNGYNLDQSLFERLVQSGLPSISLKVQHRMRPQISDFVRAQTYPHLVDHESVHRHPDVKGVAMNVVFIDHDVQEDGAKKDSDTSKSKVNSHEAELCLEIVRHILLQGYLPSDLVVLTPYVGQLLLITKLMKQNLREVTSYVSESDRKELDALSVEFVEGVDGSRSDTEKSVRCSSIDNFQGEEANIVIVSLVRSNKKGMIGFMKEPQRVNVLLSRARYGMFLVGNADTLTARPNGRAVWNPLFDMMRHRGQLLRGLPTTCQLHPHDDPIILSNLVDFRRFRPNGGCDRPCNFRMQCGHVCPKMCHPIDQRHLIAEKECCQPCQRLPPECLLFHECTKICCQECGPCETRVGPTLLPCGHVVSRSSCHDVRTADARSILSSRCKENVRHTFSACGHEGTTTCGNARSESPKCTSTCNTVLPCGHICQNMCGTCDGQHRCGIRCERSFFCGHICNQLCHDKNNCQPCDRKCERRCTHSVCPKKCFESCASCVEKCDWKCDHGIGQCPLVCGAPCSRLPCNMRCTKSLKCGHQCPSLCGEVCPSASFCQVCGQKKSEIVDMICLSAFGDHDVSTDPVICLPCGHFYAISTLDGHLAIDSAYDIDADGNFRALRSLYSSDITEKSKGCPDCRAPIHSINRYGRILKFSELRSLERKHMMSIDRSLKILNSGSMERNLNTISILQDLEDQIKQSPMKQVWEASRGDLDVEVPKPPTTQYLRIIEMLSAAFTTKIEQDGDEHYKLAITTFERGITLAGESASHTTNGRLRLMLASMLVTWTPFSPLFKAKIQGLLQWIFDQDHMPSDTKEKAANLLDGIQSKVSRKVVAEVVAAMNSVGAGYDYGGSWASHWYECPNGHPFFIGDCGGAMEVARCVECNEEVGGRGHALLRSNRTVGGVVGDIMRGL